jgi:hypothetical protein
MFFYLSKIKNIDNNYKMRGVEVENPDPKGVTLYQNVLTLDQTEEIYGYLNQEGWELRENQHVQYYGYRYDSTAMELSGTTEVSLYKAEKITGFLDCLADALVKTGMLSEKPNQITIVKYDPEDGGHLQGVTYPYPMYGKQGAILSLGSDAHMTFSPNSGKDINVKLPIGSIMTFESLARTYYKQYIRDDLTRGTYMSILFLRNSVKGKPYHRRVTKHRSRKRIRARPGFSGPSGPGGPFQRPLPGKRSGNCLSRSNVKLRPHQIDAIKYLDNHRGLIAAYATGSGKTLLAITAAECYLDKNPNGRVLIITPTAARDEFKKNMIIYGISEGSNKYCFYGYQEFINSYDWKDDTINLKGKPDAGLCTSCKDVFLIIDEAHELRTPTPWSGRKPFVPPKRGQTEKMTGLRVIRAIQCAAAAAKVLLLTATPLVNEPYDLANLLAMVRGEAPMVEQKFYDMIGMKPHVPDFVVGTEVNEKFRNQLGHELKAYKGGDFKKYFCGNIMFYKHTKDENWPSEEEIWKPIEMDEAYYQKYYDIQKKKAHLFRKHARRRGGALGVKSNPNAFYTIISQATNSIEGSPKIKEAIKYIKNKEYGEKILIYSGFLEAGLDEIKKKLDTRFYIKETVKLPISEINKQVVNQIGKKAAIISRWKSIRKKLDESSGQLTLEDLNEQFHDIIDKDEEDLRSVIIERLKSKYRKHGWMDGDNFVNTGYEEQFSTELYDKVEDDSKKLYREQIQKAINAVYHEKRLLPLSVLKEEAKDRRIPSKRIKGSSKQAYYEALRDYVEVSGDIPKTKRKDDMELFNDQDSGVDIMLISKAGGMALDLKGVRKVIILESLFNRPGEEQIKGRAIRFKSHTDPWLPKSKQHVDVIHLILTKPGGPQNLKGLLQGLPGFDYEESFNKPYKRFSTINEKGHEEKDEFPSADVGKLVITLAKDEINKEFEDKLKGC